MDQGNGRGRRRRHDVRTNQGRRAAPPWPGPGERRDQEGRRVAPPWQGGGGRRAGNTGGHLAAHLSALGLGPDETSLYLALLGGPPAALKEFAEPSGLPVTRLDAAYAGLAEIGLVVARAGRSDVVAPVPPATGLEILAQRRATELEEARAAVVGAFNIYRRRSAPGLADHPVESASGEAIQQLIEETLVTAKHEIRRFDSPPYFRGSAQGTVDELALLARGVRHRAVYSRASLEHPGHLSENIEPCMAAGEQARVLPSVPVKLNLVDDQVGLVALSIEEADINETLLVVRPCGLLSALSALFELSWQAALPLHGSAAGTPRRPFPYERRILSMLAAGVPDNQIIRELGISRRTFFRRLELLMAQAGATSRFQLALHAQRKGWL